MWLRANTAVRRRLASVTCTSIREASGLTPSERHMLELYRQNGPGGERGGRCIMDSFASHVLAGAAYVSCMQTAGEGTQLSRF